jgi:hypothetical protein
VSAHAGLLERCGIGWAGRMQDNCRLLIRPKIAFNEDIFVAELKQWTD